MQGQHSHGVAHHRCRFPQEYALANKIDHRRNVIMREDVLGTPLDTWLMQQFEPPQRRRTFARLIGRATVGAPAPAPAAAPGSTIAEIDAKLARYRTALEAGADPSVVTAWIAEAQVERHLVTQHQATSAKPAEAIQQLSEEDIIAIVEEDQGDRTAASRDGRLIGGVQLLLRDGRHAIPAAVAGERPAAVPEDTAAGFHSASSFSCFALPGSSPCLGNVPFAVQTAIRAGTTISRHGRPGPG